MVTTLADIQELLPQVEISAVSRPTEAAVTDWLAETETLLFATLAHLPPKAWRWNPAWSSLCRPRYVTPIDPDASPISAAIVQDMVASFVAAKVLRARLLGIGDVSTSGAKELQAVYDDRVKWLADPEHPFDLVDAVIIPSGTDCEDEETSDAHSWFGGARAQMGGGYRPQPRMRTRF